MCRKYSYTKIYKKSFDLYRFSLDKPPKTTEYNIETMNTNRTVHVHLSLTEEEADAFKNYCNENGLIAAQLVRRLIIKEVKEKSTILSPEYIPPKLLESLKANRR